MIVRDTFSERETEETSMSRVRAYLEATAEKQSLRVRDVELITETWGVFVHRDGVANTPVDLSYVHKPVLEQSIESGFL